MASAGLLALAGAGATALATPGSGEVPTPIARGALLGPANANVKLQGGM